MEWFKCFSLKFCILYKPSINNYLTGDIGYGDGYTEEGTPRDASATGGPSE